jgi:multiple sugar transport system permease protein
MISAKLKTKRASHASLGALSIAVMFCSIVTFTVLSAVYILFAHSDKSAINTLAEVIRDEEFQSTAIRTVLFSLICVLFKAMLAWILVPLFAAQKQAQLSSLVLLPWVLPASIASLAWLWFFYDIGGGANLLLTKLGFAPHTWLGDPQSAFWLLVAFNVWRETPLWAIALGAGIHTSDASLAALAATDGLTRSTRIRLLLIPRIKPILIALALLSFIWSAAEFDSVWLLTRGGPGNATELLTIYAFRHAILSQNLARGAAAYICFAPIMAAILYVLLLLYKRAVERAQV